jgi:hypothetical protein
MNSEGKPKHEKLESLSSLPYYFFEENGEKKFNRTRYHSAVLSALKQTENICGAKLNFITPFGFEVFHDDKFLRKNLTRFYIYIYSSVPPPNVSQLEETCLETLWSICQARDN